MTMSRTLTRALMPFSILGLSLAIGCQKIDPGATVGGSASTSTAGAGKGGSIDLGKADYSGSLSDAEKALVVATVDGESITQGELFNEVGSTLFKLRTDTANKEYMIKKRGLDELVETRLLEKEAKSKGQTVEQLIKSEVESKVAAVSDDELKSFFEQNKRRFPPNASFDEHKSELAEVFQGRKVQQARDEYVGKLKEKAKVETTLPFPDLPVAQVSADNDPVRGNKNAPVTIVEWSDYQCPYCKRNVDVLKQVEETYGDKVAVVFRDFPLPFHDKAQKASEAAECANEQGKYWEYHDRLFANQSAIDIDGLKKTAGELGLDVGKFSTCLDSGKYKEEIEKDVADGKLAGVTGTPASFINGKMINGAQPFETYKAIIDSELAKATR